MLCKILKRLYQQYWRTPLNGIEARQYDILAMHYLAPLLDFYIPWSTSAIRPSGLVAILNEIILQSYSNVVEFGGGISTLYIAKLLKTSGGKLFVFEHDEKWAHFLTSKLDEHNLLDTAIVYLVPLEPIELGEYNGEWYKVGTVQENLQDIQIDLVLVDGPPAYKKSIEYARYPAALILKKFLSSNYTIVLDDIDRRGEQWVISQWEQELSIQFDIRLLNGGIALGRSHVGLTV